jgi:hypothetical protein
VQTPEQIAYELGRNALSDQEALVAGIRQRTGTLLAAHALVASFLGSATLQAQGASPLAWVAMIGLVTGLMLAAVLLGPWPLRFALDARSVYDTTDRRAATGSGSWLATVGFAHQELHAANDRSVRWMSRLSGVLAASMVWQTLAWTVALLLR